MKIYTRTGDAGETSLFGGERVPKHDPRVEAYGTVDELNALIGVLRSEALPAESDAVLAEVQESLFAVGAALADPRHRLSPHAAAWDSAPLERWIDAMDEELDPLRHFILPGGDRAAALAHLARTVCRRAERRIQAVAGQELPPGLLPYVNRLSDALFTLARLLNARCGVAEAIWPARDDAHG